ncbi:MAG TPA: PAS domain S-box protein [Candidatus Angelobacter sp.]|nr:PAS domain S-box protein [Candidatus Angelobacter sp.]
MSSRAIRAGQIDEETRLPISQSEARFRHLLEEVPEAILEVDTYGRIVLVNDAAEKMFGYSREELLTLNVDTLVPEAQRDVHAQHRLDYAQKPERRPMGSLLELKAQRKDGSIFPIDLSLSPNRFGNVLTVIALVRDISERRRSEAQLAAARAQLESSARLAALGMMAGGVAHEINNPLTIIHASAADLLQRIRQEGTVSLEIVVRNSERIKDTANRIARIIKSMRHLAREGSQERPGPTSVAKMVEEALGICREHFKDESVNLIVPSIDPTLHVSCREIQIAQVLLNLLQNAFDAVLEQAGERWIRLDVAVRDGSVVFSIIDSGPGIPAELKTRIMEPFFTTKEVGKGTGLGLSLSRMIVEEHGGELELTEETGHTCFSFRLPLAQQTEATCN